MATIDDAIKYVGLKPGDPVYLAHDCGDHWEGRSVTIPRGQLGVVKDVTIRWDGVWHVHVNLDNSPGRPDLTFFLDDAVNLLTSTPPPPEPPTTRYEHLLADTFDDL